MSSKNDGEWVIAGCVVFGFAAFMYICTVAAIMFPYAMPYIFLVAAVIALSCILYKSCAENNKKPAVDVSAKPQKCEEQRANKPKSDAGPGTNMKTREDQHFEPHLKAEGTEKFIW